MATAFYPSFSLPRNISKQCNGWDGLEKQPGATIKCISLSLLVKGTSVSPTIPKKEGEGSYIDLSLMAVISSLPLLQNGSWTNPVTEPDLFFFFCTSKHFAELSGKLKMVTTRRSCWDLLGFRSNHGEWKKKQEKKKNHGGRGNDP